MKSVWLVVRVDDEYPSYIDAVSCVCSSEGIAQSEADHLNRLHGYDPERWKVEEYAVNYTVPHLEPK